jgi:broad specificity phosphatase PhoE
MYGRLPRWGLSDEGQRQAVALGTFLERRELEGVYASPMLRARRTAATIAQHHPGLRVRVDRRLLEVRSSWEGQPYSALDEIKWDFYANRRAPEDETIEQIRDRMLGWVQAVARRHEGEEVVGVSHGDPIIIAVAALRGLPMELAHVRPVPYIPTASVYELHLDRAGRLASWQLHVPHVEAAAA